MSGKSKNMSQHQPLFCTAGRLRSGVVLLLWVWGTVFHGSAAWALDNGLALTPPMGWNSWNKFGCDVNEPLLESVADAMATNGMRDAGYQYVIIDDCWQVGRDASGNIIADPSGFPPASRRSPITSIPGA